MIQEPSSALASIATQLYKQYIKLPNNADNMIPSVPLNMIMACGCCMPSTAVCYIPTCVLHLLQTCSIPTNVRHPNTPATFLHTVASLYASSRDSYSAPSAHSTRTENCSSTFYKTAVCGSSKSNQGVRSTLWPVYSVEAVPSMKPLRSWHICSSRFAVRCAPTWSFSSMRSTWSSF